MPIELLIFLAVGCIIGTLAGLLGIGGGTVVVPTVLFALSAFGVDQEVMMKVAVGTSFATITFSTLSSAIAHYKKGGLDKGLVLKMAVGAVVGVLIGSWIAEFLSGKLLLIIFCIFLAYVIYNMLRNAKKPDEENIKAIPSPAYLLIGGAIGFISSFIGIGGGVLIVPVLTKLGHRMRNAIGVSSSTGFFVAMVGTVTYIYHGLGTANLPPYSFGYVYLPAFVGLSITSAIFAPLGTKLAYKLPVKQLRQFFALFLAVVLITLLYKLVFPK